MNTGGFAGFDHFLVRQILFHNRQIVPDAHIEQIGHLAYHGDISANRILIQRFHGNAVDQDRSAVRVVQAGEKGKDGGFSASASSYQGHRFAGMDFQGGAAQHPVFFSVRLAVGERDIPQFQLAAHMIQMPGAKLLPRIIRTVHQLVNPLNGNAQAVSGRHQVRQIRGAGIYPAVVVEQNQRGGRSHAVVRHQKRQQKHIGAAGPADKLGAQQNEIH